LEGSETRPSIGGYISPPLKYQDFGSINCILEEVHCSVFVGSFDVLKFE
jgi:hypothetical protein